MACVPASRACSEGTCGRGAGEKAQEGGWPWQGLLLLVLGSSRLALTHLYLTVFLKLTAAASRTSTPTASPAAITCTTAANELRGRMAHRLVPGLPTPTPTYLQHSYGVTRLCGDGLEVLLRLPDHILQTRKTASTVSWSAGASIVLDMELQITLSGWILRPKTSASWAT